MLDVTRADLAPHTTLRLGGPARRLITLSNQVEIVQNTLALDASGEPMLLLAGGSNVVIADAGFAGTVLLLRSAGVRVMDPPRLAAGRAGSGHPDDVVLTVEAGHPWDEVVALAVAEGWAGIECLSGVPGSAGATPIQNVGAYGQEVAETIDSVRVLDRITGIVADLAGRDCQFAYRTSLFKHNDRYVVLAVTFRLRRSPLSAGVRYAELARALGVAPGARAPLADVRAAVLALRAGKGMVLDSTDPDTFSVGSFFVNPVLDAARYSVVEERARRLVGAQPSAWPGADGQIKVSAAWLIERAGFVKGYHGEHVGVAVSGKHTLALTNRGAGTTAALLGLAREIRDQVAQAFEVELLPEPVLVGCALS